MRIAVNTRFLLPGKLEGIGWFTCETLKRITRQHPEHDFYFFFDRPFSDEFIFADNVHPVQLFPPARHPVLFYLWFEISVAKALKKHKIDAFISTDGFMSLSTAVPTLLVIHDLAFEHFPEHVAFWHQKYYHYFMPKFAKKANRIATVSSYSKKDIKEQYDVDSEKIDVVYNGIHEDFQKASQDSFEPDPNATPYFLFVGAIHPRKNLSNILRAFEQFKAQTDAPHQLLIAGRKAWKYEKDISIWKNMKFKDEVKFIGHQSPQDLSVLLRNAFALVYTSLFEGFGIPIIEAMQCNTAVITSNTSSMPEVGGDACLLANPNEPQSIAEAMIKLHHNPELRKELIEKGKQQRQMFSWDQTADKLWQSFEKMMVKI